jgi:hypothetical protein
MAEMVGRLSPHSRPRHSDLHLMFMSFRGLQAQG